MSISTDTQAVLLLTCHFSRSTGGDSQPLSPVEWGRFALWLKEREIKPERMLTDRIDGLLKDWADEKITIGRIETLIERGGALALAADKWLRAGLWIMTRSDSDYPSRLKRRLGINSPAVLFGCGNRKLLNAGGLAVVGSRNAGAEDLKFSSTLGERTAAEGCALVSGGAKGIDQAAMFGALEAEGTAVGILAENLLRTGTSANYRRHLMADNLALVSPFFPEAGFHVGNAMQRNKYIYCLADAAVVVHSGQKGGTWGGAVENLRKGWTPLWVKKNGDERSGNSAIVGKGANWIPERVGEIDFASLFSDQDKITDQCAGEPSERNPSNTSHREPVSADDRENRNRASEIEMDGKSGDMAFYDFFLLKLESVCAATPKSRDEISAALELKNTQLDVWLKKAVSENKIEKLSNPVRYSCPCRKQSELAL